LSVCLHFSLSTSHFRKLSAVDDFWLNIDFYPIPDIFEGQGLELVVLEEVVEVLLEHLEDQTGVVLVSEALVGANEVELVRILLAQARQDAHFDLTL